MSHSVRFEAVATHLLAPKLHLSTSEYPHKNMLDTKTGPEAIYNGILSGEPFFVGRFGSVELLNCCRLILDQQFEKAPSLRYSLWRSLVGEEPTHSFGYALERNAGFFPPTPEAMKRFREVYLDASTQLDILASWMDQERLVISYINRARKMPLEALAPFVSDRPWSAALEGKRVLVVHPFANSIMSQFEKRLHLFKDPTVLPDFHLQTLPTVQSLGGDHAGFESWFDALEHMKVQIASQTFDVAILGCGAYGLPLGAYVKSLGKQAIHMGGVTQCLFGIKGKRWEEGYGWDTLYFNEYWVYPNRDETPAGAYSVEGGCYWGPEESGK